MANGKGILFMRGAHILKVLRNFGCTISSLILFSPPYRLEVLKEIIPFYVIKYCSKSLHTLRVRGYSVPCQSILESVENPFTNLKKLIIQYLIYQPKLWKFDSAVFPNLQTLKLRLIKMESMDSPKIEFTAFPALKSFAFDGTRRQNIDTFTDIIDMIKLNTQLERFKIALLEEFDEQSFDALMQCLKCLPNLQRLNLIFSGPKSVFNVRDSYHFSNVVDFGLFNIPATFSIKIPFTFNKLKCFIITTANKTTTEHLNHAHIWDFLVNNKHLTSIFLHGEVNGSFIINYEHVFSNVDELYIHNCVDIPIDSVFSLLKKNRLRKFKIAGTRQPIKRNSFEISGILNSHGIEFKSKFYFLILGLNANLRYPDIIQSNVDLSLINYFIATDSTDGIEFYSKDKLECYIPLINEYYSRFFMLRNF